jgi:hypothetical protein
MAMYGYMENGFLRARDVEQGQAQNLSSEWKPVDEIDESKTISDDEDYTIRLVPYDNGNRISFKYEKVVNTTKIQGEIDAIKAELSETDYQVIKCYEASLVGEELPYDIKALHEDRNEKRAQINALETNLTNLMAL